MLTQDLAHVLRDMNPARSAAVTGGAAAAGSLIGAIIGGVIGFATAATAVDDMAADFDNMQPGQTPTVPSGTGRFLAAPLAVWLGSIAGGAVGGMLGAGREDRGRGALGGGLGGVLGPIGAGIGGAIAGGTSGGNNPA